MIRFVRLPGAVLDVAASLIVLLHPVIASAQSPDRSEDERHALAGTSAAPEPLRAGFTYQALLLEDGTPATGTQTLSFLFYGNSACSGVELVGITQSKTIEDGIFETFLEPGDTVLNGQALWIKLSTESQTLGCFPLRAAPYAVSLRPGATIEGSRTGRDALRVVNTAGSGYSYGVYGRTDSPLGFGGYFRNSGGGAALRFVDGGLTTDRSSVVWISGNGVRPFHQSDGTIIDMSNKGSAIVRRGPLAGPKNVMLPITIPAVLYGQDVKLKYLDITWKGETSSELVGAVILRKQTGLCDSCFENLVFDLSDRSCTQNDGCTINYYLSGSYMTESAGPLYLTIELHFANSTNEIEIGGARLTIGHE